MFDSRPVAVEGAVGLSVMPENKYQGKMKTCQKEKEVSLKELSLAKSLPKRALKIYYS